MEPIIEESIRKHVELLNRRAGEILTQCRHQKVRLRHIAKTPDNQQSIMALLLHEGAEPKVSSRFHRLDGRVAHEIEKPLPEYIHKAQAEDEAHFENAGASEEVHKKAVEEMGLQKNQKVLELGPGKGNL